MQTEHVVFVTPRGAMGKIQSDVSAVPLQPPLLESLLSVAGLYLYISVSRYRRFTTGSIRDYVYFSLSALSLFGVSRIFFLTLPLRKTTIFHY